MTADFTDSDFERVVAASDLFRNVLTRQPELRERLVNDAGDTWPPPQLTDENYADWGRLLRRYRYAVSAQVIWRDVLGLDTLKQTLARVSQLADDCLQTALNALSARFAQAHGLVRDRNGDVVSLVVFGLGKLGGSELNFSSDVDLVFGYAESGESDGARPLGAEPYFTRLGQQFIKLLDETTAEGFCHRVDMRLRPYGNSGRLVWSFASMELYFQTEGRDWERYAWQKARVIAGDVDAGHAFLETLRPFVYRRYLDFLALDGVREMKASIQAEVARKDRSDDIKRGPGGIREIEFLVQALQLIRGGREPLLRTPKLREALTALVDTQQLTADNADQLYTCYTYLRRVENRLQMLRDEQTHVLPSSESDRARIAVGLGYADWDALLTDLSVVRTAVQQEFNALLAPREKQKVAGSLQDYWNALPDGGDGSVLSGIGFEDAVSADSMLRDFMRGPSVRALSDATNARFDRVAQTLLQAAGKTDNPTMTLRRMIALLQSILRRSAYIALLDEQPTALHRVVDVLTKSALMSERLTLHPMLLDELLDVRISGQGLDPDAVALQIDAIEHDGDMDLGLRQLNEIRQIASFRTAMAYRDGRIDELQTTDQLAWLAEACLSTVLRWVREEMQAAHGEIEGSQFGVVGYGSVGARELNFGSDLDLVFLFDADPNAMSDGKRSLDSVRYFARLAQKLVAYLAVQTPAGRLFDVDMRLRPDGAKGLLVSSVNSYAQYQRERAWTWEHQALVRSRRLAGDAELLSRFDELRTEILTRTRDPELLLSEVNSMRARMRKELDRSTADRLDLKQGRGGLVDLEFLLQLQVLESSGSNRAWLSSTRTIDLLQHLDAADELTEAYRTLLRAGLECGLDRRPRLVLRDETIVAAADAIVRATPGFDADPQ